MTQEETKEETKEEAEELREVNDPEFLAFEAKIPAHMAGDIEELLSRRRRQSDVAFQIRERAKVLSLEFIKDIETQLKEIDPTQSEDLQAEALAENVSFTHAVGSMLVARCVMLTWQQSGSKALDKNNDLMESALDGFIADLMAGEYDGPLLPQPEYLKRRQRSVQKDP